MEHKYFKENNIIEFKVDHHTLGHFNDTHQMFQWNSIQNAVNTTIKKLFVRGLIDNSDKADEELKDYLESEITEGKERRWGEPDQGL